MSSSFIGRSRTQTSPPAAVPTMETTTTTTTATTTTSPPVAQEAQPSTAAPIWTTPGYCYRLPAKQQSATDVWRAWHGLGPYKNEPVAGGVPVMDRDLMGWCNMYTANKQKALFLLEHYSELNGQRDCFARQCGRCSTGAGGAVHIPYAFHETPPKTEEGLIKFIKQLASAFVKQRASTTDWSSNFNCCWQKHYQNCYQNCNQIAGLAALMGYSWLLAQKTFGFIVFFVDISENLCERVKVILGVSKLMLFSCAANTCVYSCYII